MVKDGVLLMSATDEVRALLTDSGTLWANVISNCKRTLWRPGNDGSVVCYFDEMPSGVTVFTAQMVSPGQALAATNAIGEVEG